MKGYLFSVIAFVFIACKPNQVVVEKKSNSESNFKELIEIMQGNYTSLKQSKLDTSYYNISMRMVPIWKEKGNFLYVEQALYKVQEKPYRVRIYKLIQKSENDFVSEIYTINDEKKWIGKWRSPNDFDTLTESEISWKEGCGVNLKRVGSYKFVGETSKKTCLSEMQGASYASSKVTITKNQIESWDQGFDANDIQVWGEEKGGYIFVK